MTMARGKRMLAADIHYYAELAFPIYVGFPSIYPQPGDEFGGDSDITAAAFCGLGGLLNPDNASVVMDGETYSRTTAVDSHGNTNTAQFGAVPLAGTRCRLPTRWQQVEGHGVDSDIAATNAVANIAGFAEVYTATPVYYAGSSGGADNVGCIFLVTGR